MIDFRTYLKMLIVSFTMRCKGSLDIYLHRDELLVSSVDVLSYYSSKEPLFMLSVRISVINARGKFGEHKRSVRVAEDSREQL